MESLIKLVIVTGLSGSGKSIALHTLEDLGFYCIDNLPVFLLETLIDRLVEKDDGLFRKTAVGIDGRNQHSALEDFPNIIKRLREHNISSEIIFLDSETPVLSKRYSETRRKHPLSHSNCSLEEAILKEREMMRPFFQDAELRIDTSHTNQHQLRDILRDHFHSAKSDKKSLMFISFGFKHGLPMHTDFVFDVRCLPNPHWEPELRHLTGESQEIVTFLEKDQSVLAFKTDIIDFLEKWLPSYQSDGRHYLTVAIGCTGGHHRSVYMVEQLAAHFTHKKCEIIKRHRELV